MKRLTLDINTETGTGKVSIEMDISSPENNATNLESKFIARIGELIADHINTIPGGITFASGATVEECRAKAKLQTDIMEAGKFPDPGPSAPDKAEDRADN